MNFAFCALEQSADASVVIEKEDWLPEVPIMEGDLFLQSMERLGTDGKKMVAIRKF